MMSEVKPSHIEHMIAFAELRGSLAGNAARVELAQLRTDLVQAQARIAELTAERDALAAESDAVHRAVNEMCGTDTSTIEAVQHVISERDAARAERDAAKQYQRMAARR